MPNGNVPTDWNHQAVHVLTELKRLSDVVDEQVREIAGLRSDLKVFRAVSGVWGAGAALFVTLACNFIIQMFKNRL